MTTPDTPLRADARRNRDQILAAAREIFAERGADVAMEEIARRASVGVGTLYRRFADREALIRAVFRETFQVVADETRAALAEEPTAWAALMRIMRQSAWLHVSVQAKSELVTSVVKGDPDTSRMRDHVLDTLDEVVRRAQEEGSLRLDVGVGDLAVLFMSVVKQPHNLTAEAAGVAPVRALAIMMDGLRAPAPGELPGRPLTRADLDFDA
ncbi:helix-turn-helix domain-containing protein [Actinophytocola sp.]|jgi:AcrR family transcriptional regulator|uniref:TetR/AcrR family transcriptional regulator n=1 Tax=Actinophytocola sp. TaxID=1872138 RepID=UPI002D369F2C|nr:helix-turn-helix domain-containing protein [Actinophytocola sp.]HYQ65820.1 helix-turn-helix domain-containing protein [Actinophytocola sp.]